MEEAFWESLTLKQVAQSLGVSTEEVLEGISKLQERVKELERELQRVKSESARKQAKERIKEEGVGEYTLFMEFWRMWRETFLRELADQFRQGRTKRLSF